jgi:hypothetical protein
VGAQASSSSSTTLQKVRSTPYWAKLGLVSRPFLATSAASCLITTVASSSADPYLGVAGELQQVVVEDHGGGTSGRS